MNERFANLDSSALAELRSALLTAYHTLPHGTTLLDALGYVEEALNRRNCGCAQCGSPMDGEGWECPRCGTV